MNVMNRIEELRHELVRLGMEKGFQDIEVVNLSQKLDELINQYYRLTKQDANAQLAS